MNGEETLVKCNMTPTEQLIVHECQLIIRAAMANEMDSETVALVLGLVSIARKAGPDFGSDHPATIGRSLDWPLGEYSRLAALLVKAATKHYK